MINIKNITNYLNKKDSTIQKTFFEIVYIINKEVDEKNEVYKNWCNSFVYCYGDLNKKDNTANAKKCVETINKLYNTNIKHDNIYKFIFSLQATYTILLKLIVIDSFFINNKVEINKKDFMSLMSGEIIEKELGHKIWDIDWFYIVVNFWNNIGDLINTFNKIILKYKDNKDVDYSVAEEFKKMYEYLFPKEIRHSLGEYYTPFWLAEDIYTNIKKHNQISNKTSFIDPTCGSGVFLECLLKNNKEISTNNIYGFDINLIAVLTTKIVIIYNRGINTSINIFQNDILMYPNLINEDFSFDVISEDSSFDKNYYIYIYGNKFSFPKELYDNKQKLLEYFEESQNNKKTELYKQLNKYDEVSKKIYINLLKERIESIYIKNIDFVIGNPPWINWEYLPEISKELTKKIWIKYGLFEQNGKKLSFSKEDISLLVTYITIDILLKKHGIICFVIRMGSFKSKQNGVGFRNFKLGTYGEDIKVIHVDDFSNVNVFPGAINTSCVAYMEKGEKTVYPVSFSTCTIKNGEIIKTDEIAMPTTSEKNSMWLNTTQEKLKQEQLVLGKNNYKARTGVFTGGANAVYWIRTLKQLDNGNILIENVVEGAKRKAPKVQFEIEKGLVYELCRGAELGKESKNKISIICPHTKLTKMKAIDLEKMKKEYPLTLDYLSQFKDILDDRKGFASWEKSNQEDSFYAIQRIGEYTFKKYKVAWKYISKKFEVFLINNSQNEMLENKIVLPSEKIMYVALDDKDEANYLAGILNSNVVKETVESFMTETSISTHVLDKLKIENYNPNNKMHKEIANNFENKNYSALNSIVYKYYNNI